MIERLRAAWAALCGGLVLDADHWVIVATDASGSPLLTRWHGLLAEDAGMALYRSADSIAERLPAKSLTIH